MIQNTVDEKNVIQNTVDEKNMIRNTVDVKLQSCESRKY